MNHYRPTFTLADDHPSGRAVLAKAESFIGTEQTWPTPDAARSAGRVAVGRALAELGLCGARVTPPRVRVGAVEVVPVAELLARPRREPRHNMQRSMAEMFGDSTYYDPETKTFKV